MVVVHTCNIRARKAETARSLELTGQPVIDPVSITILEVVPWPLPVHMYLHVGTHTNIQDTHAHMDTCIRVSFPSVGRADPTVPL